MGNQIRMAERAGVRASTVNSENGDDREVFYVLPSWFATAAIRQSSRSESDVGHHRSSRSTDRIAGQ
jgi:hypothetical protein